MPFNQLLYQKIKNLGLGLILMSIVFAGCQSRLSDQNQKADAVTQAVDSIEIVTNLIKQDSADSELFEIRSRLFLKNGQIDPAFRDLSYAIDKNPNDPELFILLGDIYFITGQKENCLSSYRKAGALDPKSLVPVLKLAETHLIMREFETAEQFIDIALNMDINNPKAYYLRGIQKMETGDTTLALTNLKIAGNLDSTYYETFMQIGTLYTSLNDTTAIDYYKAALKALPDEERALFMLGFTYQSMGDFEKAIAIYRKVNELYPSNKRAYYNSGYINMVEFRDFEIAKDDFRQAIAIDPSYVEAVYNLGRIYEETGEYDLARNHYRQALELRTNYPLAIDGLNRLDDLQYSD
jgi:tetratricopeptide (TPR) repeat protein